MVLPKNSKDVKGLRDMLTGIRTQLCSASEAFSEPLKKLFTEISEKFNAVITALPTGDVCGDWSVESQLENLFGLLTCASAAASQAGLEITKLKADQAEMARQYASQLTTEIEAKVKAGELFTKAAHTAAVEGLVPQTTVTQLCSAAREAGVLEGENKIRVEMATAETQRALVATRKAGLQTASFPLPEAELENLLSGSDEEFTKAKALVESRLASLKNHGIQLNSGDLLSKLWLPAAQYTIFEKTILGIPALKVVAEPLAGGPGNSSLPKDVLIV